MLTIRCIADSGFEMVREVSSVQKRPGRETARGRTCLTYFETKPGEEPRAIEDIYDGIVYVMNENGKTIAKYDLAFFTDPQELVQGGSSEVELVLEVN